MATPPPGFDPAASGDVHFALLSALVAVAGHRHDRCHGFDADTHPAEFAASVLHDIDPLVPLPAGATA